MLFHLPDGFLVSPEMIHVMLMYGWRITPSSRTGWSIMVRVPTLKRGDPTISSVDHVSSATGAAIASNSATFANSKDACLTMGATC